MGVGGERGGPESPYHRLFDRFPQHASELDAARQTLDGGTDLINEEHPGFHDKESPKHSRAGSSHIG